MKERIIKRMIIYCPNCNQKYEVDISLVGSDAECEICQEVFSVKKPGTFQQKENEIYPEEPVKNEKDKKQCPYCAEDINIEAIKCRYCGEMLNGETKEVESNSKDYIIPQKGEIICPNPNCGYVGKPKKVARGSCLIGIILLCLFLLPGILYFMFMSGYRYQCLRCGVQISSDV